MKKIPQKRSSIKQIVGYPVTHPINYAFFLWRFGSSLSLPLKPLTNGDALTCCQGQFEQLLFHQAVTVPTATS